MRIRQAIEESIRVKQLILDDRDLEQKIQHAVKTCVEALRADRKILFCGNGGSAADAQHLAAELSGRFYFDREPLAAEALHVNTSFLTAVANDYSYDEVYARLVKGLGKKGDVLFGLSTSGNSTNVIRAFQEAAKKGMTTVALTGSSGGKMKDLANIIFRVPSDDTPRIQEAHILIGHIICELIEKELFSE